MLQLPQTDAVPEQVHEDDGEGKKREEEIDRDASLTGEELPRDGGRIIEIHDPGTARGGCNQHPGAVLRDLARPIGAIARAGIQLHARIAIPFDPALHEHEKICPDRLRAGITAPGATGNRGNQEQADACHYQKASNIEKFLGLGRAHRDEYVRGPVFLPSGCSGRSESRVLEPLVSWWHP